MLANAVRQIVSDFLSCLFLRSINLHDSVEVEDRFHAGPDRFPPEIDNRSLRIAIEKDRALAFVLIHILFQDK